LLLFFSFAGPRDTNCQFAFETGPEKDSFWERDGIPRGIWPKRNVKTSGSGLNKTDVKEEN